MTKTDFSPNTPVGAVYAAVLEACEADGKTRQACESDIHQGYVDNVTLIPLRTFVPDTITAGEVLEHAYRFDRFWPVLQKNGFPVPMGVQRPTGGGTNELESTLDRVAATATKAAESQGLKPHTDAYVEAVARILYDWGVQHLDFSNDCPDEATNLEAWQQQCGFCSERTYIMYRVFQLAGLGPSVLHVFHAAPTLDKMVSYERMPFDQLWQEHVCLGIPRLDGTLLHVDVTARRFDAQYRHVVALTPRQAVAEVYFQNQLSSVVNRPTKEAHRIRQLTDATLAIAPHDFQAGSLACMNSSQDLDHQTPACTGFAQRFATYSPHAVYAAWIQILKGFGGGNSAAFQGAVEHLGNTLQAVATQSPKAAAWLAFGCGRALREMSRQIRAKGTAAAGSVSTLNRLLQIVDRFAVHLFGLGLTWYPEFPAPYIVLGRLMMDSVGPAEVLPWLEQVATAHPAFAIAQYSAAPATMNASIGKTVEEARPLLSQYRARVDALKKIEPNHHRTIMMEAFGTRITDGAAVAIGMMEALVPRVRHDPMFHGHLASLYFQDCQARAASKRLLQIMEDDPWQGPWTVASFIAGIHFDISNAEESSVVQRVSTIRCMDELGPELFRVTKAVHQRLPSNDTKGWLLRQALFAQLMGDSTLWPQAMTMLSTPWSDPVKMSMARDLATYTEALAKSPAPQTARQIAKGLAKMGTILEARLGPLPELLNFYFVVAKQFVVQGDAQRALPLVKRMMSLDPTRAHEMIFTMMIQEYFSEAVMATQPSRDTIRALVCAIAVSLRAKIPWIRDRRVAAIDYLQKLPAAMTKNDPALRTQLQQVIRQLQSTR